MTDALSRVCPSCGNTDADYPDCAACGHDFTAAQPAPAPSRLDDAAAALLAKDEPRPPRHTRWKLERLSLDQPAPTSWLVRRYLTRHSLACIFGASGSGKSFLAVDLACAVATGRSWNGAKVSPGPVVYLAGEGHAGLRKRFLAWSLHHGVDLAGADIHLSNGAIALDASEPFETVRASLFEALGERRPALIVVDTAARHMTPGADENSGVAMGPLIDACDELVRETGATCVIIHHTGHAAVDRERGWSGLRAALDWSYSVQRGDGGPLIVQCRKSKDHEMPEPVQLRLQPIELPWTDDEGEAERSAILAPDGQTAGGMGARQLQAMMALRRLAKDCHPAPVKVSDWRAAAGVDRRRWRECLETLRDRGLILLDGDHVRPAETDPVRCPSGSAPIGGPDKPDSTPRTKGEPDEPDARTRQTGHPDIANRTPESAEVSGLGCPVPFPAPVRQSKPARNRRATGALAQPVKPPKPEWAAE